MTTGVIIFNKRNRNDYLTILFRFFCESHQLLSSIMFGTTDNKANVFNDYPTVDELIKDVYNNAASPKLLIQTEIKYIWVLPHHLKVGYIRTKNFKNLYKVNKNQ